MRVEVDEKEIVTAILNGLPSNYENLMFTLCPSGEEEIAFTLNLIKLMLLQEEQRKPIEETMQLNQHFLGLVILGLNSTVVHPLFVYTVSKNDTENQVAGKSIRLFV